MALEEKETRGRSKEFYNRQKCKFESRETQVKALSRLKVNSHALYTLGINDQQYTINMNSVQYLYCSEGT